MSYVPIDFFGPCVSACVHLLTSTGVRVVEANDVRFDVLTITEKHAVSGLAHPEMHQCPVPPVALHGAWSNMVANCNSS